MSGIDPTSPPQRPRTLLEELACDIESARAEAHGCVGDRPYRVTILLVAWSGGQPGRGRREELRRTDIGCGVGCDGQVVPPKVLLEGSYARSMHGLVEQGRAVIEELAPSYTEAQLVSYGRQTEAEQSFVLIEQDGRGGDATDRPVRWYQIDGPPFLATNPYGWVLRLRSVEPQQVFKPAQGDAR